MGFRLTLFTCIAHFISYIKTLFYILLLTKYNTIYSVFLTTTMMTTSLLSISAVWVSFILKNISFFFLYIYIINVIQKFLEALIIFSDVSSH